MNGSVYPSLVVLQALFPGEHGSGLAFQVEIWLAADVDRDPLDRAAGKPPGPLAGVVADNGRAAVTADAQALTGQLEVAGLGLDARLADLPVAVVEAQHAGGDPGRIFAVLVDRDGEARLADILDIDDKNEHDT